MTTPTNLTGRVAGPRWFFFAAAGCAAVAAVIAVVVFVVLGDDTEGQAAAAGETAESAEVNYDDLTMPTIPYTEVTEWSSKRVDMQGELPEGTIYRSIDSNPSWAKVNRFTGEMHYEPKQAGIQLRPHDITIAAELPNGETMNIETTVEVTKYESEEQGETIDPPILPRTTVSPGDSVTVSLEGPQMPEGTTYIDNVGPLWMNVDKNTGDVHFNLDETFEGYPTGVQDILITASLPDGGGVATIESEVEVVAN